MKRTLEELRNSMDGKIYIRCGSEEVFRKYLADAEAEGYLIGDKKPTDAGVAWDIKALEHGKQISNVSTMGHIACQAGGDNIHIIDYDRYSNGEKEYEVSGL